MRNYILFSDWLWHCQKLNFFFKKKILVKPKNVEQKFDSFAQTHARTHSHTHSHIHAHAPAHASFYFPSPNQIKSFSKNLSLMLCVFRTL